jgi:diguanylate cyclase (GGDEF)-like protein/PAS domain S-box-containing protein
LYPEPGRAGTIMMRLIPGRRKVSNLIVAGFLFILFLSIGFSSAIVYNMARHQASTHDIYIHSLSLSNAEQDVQSDLARLHNLMLGIIIASKPGNIEQQRMQMRDLDEDLRKDFALLESEFQGESGKVSEMNRLMSDWQNVRLRMTSLVLHGHRDKAMKLGLGEGVRLYRQLEMDMNLVVASAQQRVKTLAEDAAARTTEIIHLAWWFLAGLIVSNVLLGAVIVFRVNAILEHDEQTAKKLLETDERLKLALSGADEGTWDMDVPTGNINFDSQWGEMLGYRAEKERPYNLQNWMALIHEEDRDRVSKAMQDHINNRTAEYNVEYRIRSGSGALKWVAGRGKAVHRDAHGKATRVVGITRDITLKKQSEEKIWQMAHTDSLTGLPNRVSFYDRLNQATAYAKRHHTKYALLFLDLDGFKNVNDRFGHDVGDKLLQEVAGRLRLNVRGEDTAARTGGDEFIFILNDVAHAKNAAIVSDKIIRSLAEPFMIDGNTCQIGGSIGISIFPDDSDNMETLVSQSDDAMYRAKASGKNNYQFFMAPTV